VSGHKPVRPGIVWFALTVRRRMIPGVTATEKRHPATSGRDDPYALKFPVVALVASAGGLDALSRVVAPLPADLPAAVLVVLHLSPGHPSHLAEILAQHTELAVHVARNGDELRTGTLLVTPPARHLLVTSEARIGLIDSGALPPARPSADLLLATLAVTCGPRALAVVLTGKGNDAQAGIRAIVHCGGTVFAQDEATSAHFGMPGAAIDTQLVHRILPLADIATAVRAHVAIHQR
jgi:two-component system chemotaxis response regulator CheB